MSRRIGQELSLLAGNTKEGAGGELELARAERRRERGRVAQRASERLPEAKKQTSKLPQPAIERGKVESTAMETAKEQVQRILEVLPDDASLEDIQYHIYVRQKVDQGLADGDAGRVVSHEEAMRRLDKWRIR